MLFKIYPSALPLESCSLMLLHEVLLQALEWNIELRIQEGSATIKACIEHDDEASADNVSGQSGS